MKNDQINELYKNYCFCEGNEYIASEYAIKKLNDLINTFNVRSILEIGLGIGSISGILLTKNKRNFTYTGTEENKFCLQRLPGNLKDNFDGVLIYNNIAAIPQTSKFDLIIIDGKDEDLKRLQGLVEENGIIAIEGDRISQREYLKSIFPKHILTPSISLCKNKIYSPFENDNWQGGLKIIFVKPTLFQRLWWVKERFLSKIKYILRNQILK